MVDPRARDLARRYAVRIDRDDYQGYCATSPAFADVLGVGATPEEALASLYDGLTLAVDWCLQQGEPLPAPEAVAA